MQSDWNKSREEPDGLPEFETGMNGSQHPTPEQLLLREAISRALMRDQKKLWELYNYDRLTVAEIARKFRISHQAVSKRIKVIERILTIWVKEHQEVYVALSEAQNVTEDENTGC